MALIGLFLLQNKAFSKTPPVPSQVAGSFGIETEVMHDSNDTPRGFIFFLLQIEDPRYPVDLPCHFKSLLKLLIGRRLHACACCAHGCCS